MSANGSATIGAGAKAGAASAAGAASIMLVGNPNSGKTTLFNALTGLSARVGNYPGITVEHKEGTAHVGDAATGGARKVRVIDLPGTYSLAPRSDDEVVAVRGVLGALPETAPADLIVAVVDATALERNLYLVSQLRELPLPIVVALTMMDTLEQDGTALDVETLAKRIGVPVVAAPGVRGGADALKKKIAELLDKPATTKRLPLNPPKLRGVDDAALAKAGAATRAPTLGGADERALGLWAAGVTAMGTPDRLVESGAVRVGRFEREHDARVIATKIARARYQRVSEWVAGVIEKRARAGGSGDGGEERSVRFTRVVDAFALHRVLGPVILVGIFLALFQALFSWSTPLMDGIEALMGMVSERVSALIPESLPLLRSLVVNGIVAGVGNVVVFVPQIAVLFLFLAILEDSGYLARAAFILDRLMARVGLHGRAFVPMLSGFACAVPAIMATRTIESNKDRIVTILVTPLISCSARLPVYALMIATVFATSPKLFGVIEPGAAVMISMYSLSIFAAIGMAAVFKRTLLKSPTPPLVLELPPYRVPKLGAVLRAVWTRVKIFLTEAGTVILAITIVLWGLFTFPRDESIAQTRDAAKAAVELTHPEGEARDAELAKIDARAARQQVEESIAGRLGRAMEPVIAPLGYDWKLGVGIIASFAAREVLVSTLGLVYGLGDGTDEESTSLREAMRADTHDPDGDGVRTPVYTPLTALSLLVFFVLAMQCMSTLAAVKRETGGWKWPMVQLGYMTVLAYVAALIVYQGGKLLGFQ